MLRLSTFAGSESAGLVNPWRKKKNRLTYGTFELAQGFGAEYMELCSGHADVLLRRRMWASLLYILVELLRSSVVRGGPILRHSNDDVLITSLVLICLPYLLRCVNIAGVFGDVFSSMGT